MSYALRTILAVAIFFVVALRVPALADGPLSVYVGAGETFQNYDSLGFVGDVGAGYDLGPKASVPIRARIDADAGFGGVTTNSGLNTFGIGASIRSTTPTYFGIGTAIYDVNIPSQGGSGSFPICPASSVSLGCGSTFKPLPTNVLGIGANVFFGQKLFSSRALGLSLEVSYKEIPGIGDINPSALGIGLRGSF